MLHLVALTRHRHVLHCRCAAPRFEAEPADERCQDESTNRDICQKTEAFPELFNKPFFFLIKNIKAGEQRRPFHGNVHCKIAACATVQRKKAGKETQKWEWRISQDWVRGKNRGSPIHSAPGWTIFPPFHLGQRHAERRKERRTDGTNQHAVSVSEFRVEKDYCAFSSATTNQPFKTNLKAALIKM